MKLLGLILIVAGILMMVFRGFYFTKKEKVLDLGPVEINKKKEAVYWPEYAGALVTTAGVIIFVAGKKRN